MACLAMLAAGGEDAHGGLPGRALADVWVWTAGSGWQPGTLGPPALEHAAMAPAEPLARCHVRPGRAGLRRRRV